MYIVSSVHGHSVGETLEAAIEDYEYRSDVVFDIEECAVYEANKIKVKRTFEIVKEQA